MVGNLQSLRKLNLQVNQLVSVPNKIGGLRNLQQDLNRDKLDSLPDEIRSLAKLRVLRLDSNKPICFIDKHTWEFEELKNFICQQ